MYTIKIIGISGVGKTTLAKLFLHKRPDIARMSFGEFLYEYENDESAREEWGKFLSRQENLVLIEEHLEIGEDNLADIYMRENTKAIFLIEPSLKTVIRRRERDIRQRPNDQQQIVADMQKSRRRAVILARKLNVPLIIAKDEEIEKSIERLSQIIDQVERKECLLKRQQNLNLEFTDLNLSKLWNSHWLMNSLRQAITPLVEQKSLESIVCFDPQDLEHQALFYLTTFDPGSITQQVISDAVDEQYLIVQDRLLNAVSNDELTYIFRGLKKFYPDLNSTYRLKLIWKNTKLVAVGEGREFEVEFKKVEADDKIIKLFTEVLHYVHQERSQGDIFGFYFKGDSYPWAIETCESGQFIRPYKKDALIAHGIDPERAIEITRLYALPGSPLNFVSVMDSFIRKYYKAKRMEALLTCTMPSYSKSRSTTTAGGLDKVLCAKQLKHSFIPKEIKGRQCWMMATKRWLENNAYEGEIKDTHPFFTLFPKIDVFTTIQRHTTLNPLPGLNGNVIFFK